jgi:peroxiredoxin
MLRGRIVAMDDAKLTVEVRLETKVVPRERISQIIWLHSDELDGEEGVPAVAPGDDDAEQPGIRVQVLRSDGIRLTFFADQMNEATLSGTSDILGACRVGLNQVDQLLIGGAIEQAASMLAYQQWKLHNAIEPKTADGGSGDGSTGLESPLVGKPAPEFELALLDGKRFRLSEARGRVIVLDFWATWCGPCIQAMPQVDAAVRDFADQGVQLIAVNLEETPKQITAMLERHKLEMTVALDRDGAVGGKYGATAIPQTVIIDRDGKVARLFVGGGPQFGDQIREALKAVLGGNDGDPKGDPQTDPVKAAP